MKLTQLRYAIAVYEHRNFNKAAKACFVSQPTLSVAIKALEEELGCELFGREKSKAGVEVTIQGEAVIAEARMALAAVDRVKNAARGEVGFVNATGRNIVASAMLN